MRVVLILLRRALFNSFLDGCFGIAKGAAYSGLLSLFPVLSSLAAVLVHANAGRAAKYLAEFIFEVIPPGTTEMIARQFNATGERPVSLLVVAVILSIWAASSFMVTLMEGFRAAYRLPGGRGIVQDRVVAMALVFVTAMPALGASALLVYGDALEATLQTMSGWVDNSGQIAIGVSIFSRLARWLVALGATVLTTALLYYVGPNRPQKWLAVWPGAVVATALWLIVTVVFGWYVRNLANYNVMYGSVGGVIALIVWMYLLAAIALFGCEYNAELERIRKRAVAAPSTL